MKEIFTDLYKKVAGFFQAPVEKENVKEVACNRLKFVLMQDRTNLNPQLLERMRNEMIDLLSKYVEMDKEALELNFEQEGDSMALMLSIPVLRAKEEEEIQAIIDAERIAKARIEEETNKCNNEENENSEDDVQNAEESDEADKNCDDEIINKSSEENVTEDVIKEAEDTQVKNADNISCENTEEAIEEIVDVKKESPAKKNKKPC